jgi:hypothetical protein
MLPYDGAAGPTAPDEEPEPEPVFGQLPERGAYRRVVCERGASDLVGVVAERGAADLAGAAVVVFEPVAAAATPEPIATTAVVPASASRYLR